MCVGGDQDGRGEHESPGFVPRVCGVMLVIARFIAATHLQLTT